jgi:hypothetical protein
MKDKPRIGLENLKKSLPSKNRDCLVFGQPIRLTYCGR